MEKTGKKSAKIEKTTEKLIKIGVRSAGVTLACVYAVLGLIVAAFFLIFRVFISRRFAMAPAPSAALIILSFPAIFAILGFVKGILVAWIYNYIAKSTGGITFTVSG